MAKNSAKHGTNRSIWSGLAVFVVFAFSGSLLMTNLRVNRTTTVTSDTSELVEQRVEQVNELQKQVNTLSSQVNMLNTLAGDDGEQDTDGQSEDAGQGTMLAAVEGEGLSVTLNDSPLWENMVDSSGSASNINDYVIHQQDVEAVVNALGRGGAESMMIQDQRVLFNSAVICQGNVLLLQGKKYSPPYTISAIGPVTMMRAALDSSPAIDIYKQYVSAFGLGWKVETQNSLKFPETAALLQPLRYASVNKGETDK